MEWRKRNGQTTVLFALSVVALLSLVALGLDGASMFVQRRIAQNAADSAALGAARVLAVRGGNNSAGMETLVLETLNRLAASNQIDLQGNQLDEVTDTVEAYFLDSASNVTGERIGENSGVPANAVGVRVRPSKAVASLIAQVIGINQVGSAADSDVIIYQTGYSQYSPGSGLMPIGIPEVIANTTASYNIWTPQNGYTGDSQFKGLLDYDNVTGDGYVDDPADDGMNKPAAANYWSTYGYQGRIATGNDIALANGDLGNNVASGLRTFINNHAQYDDPLHPSEATKWARVYVPIYEYPFAETQPEGTIHVIGFAAFKLYYGDVSSSSASGYWVSYVNAEGIPQFPVSDPVNYRGPITIKLSN